MASNALPAELKNQLIGLGAWSMRYSTLALLQDLSLEPLIEVNRNIAEGLAMQNTARPQVLTTLGSTTAA